MIEKDKILYPTKCDCCNEIFENVDINGYVVVYQSWEGYNCCSEECAIKRAENDGITDILRVER